MAIRNFELIGTNVTPGTTGSITINGVEVFSGDFLNNTTVENPIATGSVDIDDSSDIQVPVVVTLTSGIINVGMFKWNYGQELNPALTEEEATYATVLTTEVPAEIATSVASKGGFYIRSADVYAYGITEAQTNSNRSDLLVNGSPTVVPAWDYISLNNTDVFTFDTLIFSRA